MHYMLLVNQGTEDNNNCGNVLTSELMTLLNVMNIYICQTDVQISKIW